MCAPAPIQTPAWALPLEGVFVTFDRTDPRKACSGITTLDAGFGLRSDDRLIVLTREQGQPSDNGWAFRVVDERLYMAGIDDGASACPSSAAGSGTLATRRTRSTPAKSYSVAIGRGHGSQRVRCCNGGATRAARSMVAISGSRRSRAPCGVDAPSISGAAPTDGRSRKHAASQAVSPTDTTDASAVPAGGNRVMWKSNSPASRFANRKVSRSAIVWMATDDRLGRCRHAPFGLLYQSAYGRTYRFRVQSDPARTASQGQLKATIAFFPGARLVRTRAWRFNGRQYAPGLGLVCPLLMLTPSAGIARSRHSSNVWSTPAPRRCGERMNACARRIQTLAQESQTDPLTGLHNRRFLLDQVNNLLLARAREGGEARIRFARSGQFQTDQRYPRPRSGR